MNKQFESETSDNIASPEIMNLSTMTKEEIDNAVIRTIESSKAGEVMSVEESMDRFCAMHNIPRERLHN